MNELTVEVKVTSTISRSCKNNQKDNWSFHLFYLNVLILWNKINNVHSLSNSSEFTLNFDRQAHVITRDRNLCDFYPCLCDLCDEFANLYDLCDWKWPFLGFWTCFRSKLNSISSASKHNKVTIHTNYYL